jgi:glycine cleavage system H protein
MYPSEYRYTEEHEWILVEDDTCTLGITDFAQGELGEVVYIELPDVGDTFDAGDEIGSIESVKAVSSIFTPLAGEVVEVNEKLEDSPETVNNDPHGDGWLVKLKVETPEDAGALMDAESYTAFLQEEDDDEDDDFDEDFDEDDDEDYED